MTREQAALLRLLLMCVAWAVGGIIALAVAVPLADVVLPAALAALAYVVTGDLGRPRPGGADAKYWRGRRIDGGGPGRGRWN